MDHLYNSVLDPKQLKRIESVHRGFLYQHLYAVGCLFLAPSSNVKTIIVEKDEDIELILDEKHFYLQVKTRSRPLIESDIAETLSRFDALRKEYSKRQRKLNPLFLIISNMAPGKKLLSEIEDSTWPSDVEVLWPGYIKDNLKCLPPAWTNLSEAITWCTDKAKTIPYSMLSPETLVWKLSALIQYACTGESSEKAHKFEIKHLPKLFEQLAIQLQEFPQPLPDYREHEIEPSYDMDEPVRLVVGFSGSGKTAWASQASIHVGKALAYYDTSDVLDLAFTSSLTRELIGCFFRKKEEGLSSVLFPGASAIESLRALSLTLRESEINTTVFIDNAHRITSDEIINVIKAASTIKWVILLQPGQTQKEIETKLNLRSEYLNGWSINTIAAEFSAKNCMIDPANSNQIKNITGGLPLFVRNAAYITKERYNGNVEKFCKDIESLTHLERTSQEVILQRVLNDLSEQAKDVTGILSLSDISLTSEEAKFLLNKTLKTNLATIPSTFRELVEKGVLQLHVERKLFLHEAFRLIAAEHRGLMSKEVVDSAKSELKRLVAPSEGDKLDVARLAFYLKLLHEVGETKTFVDLVTNDAEFFDELGLRHQIISILEQFLSSDQISAIDQFWVLDVLAFWDLQEGNLKSAKNKVSQMESLLKSTDIGEHERSTYYMKLMILHSKEGDFGSVIRLFQKAIDCVSEPKFTRIFRYNFALALFFLEDYSKAEKEAFQLSMEYYEILGLNPEDVFAKNIPEIMEKLNDIAKHQIDIKHLADSLDLYGRSRIAQKKDYGLARIHAHKFYAISNSFKSAVKVGQDVVDDYLEYLGDPNSARSFIEKSLLPLISDLKLLGYVIPVRSQYAVVLSYCGAFAEAKAEMDRLSYFADTMSDDQFFEFNNQRLLIQDIEEGRIQLEEPVVKSVVNISDHKIPVLKPKKIGRNKPCPCGSGLKYKKCCGY